MRFCYINIIQIPPPRDAVYLRGLKENGCEILYCVAPRAKLVVPSNISQDMAALPVGQNPAPESLVHLQKEPVAFWGVDNDSSPTFLKKMWQIIKKHQLIKNNYDILWVGYGAHTLVPLARLMSRKKIVFNALGSLYEGIIISRRQAATFSLKAAYCWLVDFLAFHCASVSLVESNEQKKWLMKKFFLRDDKLFVALTGVDDNLFFYEPSIVKPTVFTVLFRGGFLPESGIEYAIEAARILKNEDIKFRILGRGQMENKVRGMLASFDSKNVEWLSEKLDQNELRQLMQECHLSLGQLSNHERLDRTIPHKAFESIAMKLPYLTARNKGILELLEENKTCFCCNPADAQDLARKIFEIKNNPTLAAQIADNAYELYQRRLTPKILAKQVADILTN